MRRTGRPGRAGALAGVALAVASVLLGGGSATAADRLQPPGEPTTNPSGTCVSEGELPWIGVTDLVELKVRADESADAEDRPAVRFVLRQTGVQDPLSDMTVGASGGSLAVARVPSELVAEGGEFWWQSRMESGSEHSAWTTPCGFRTDYTRPGAPLVEFTDLDAHPRGAPPGTVRTVRFTLPEGTEATHVCFDPMREVYACRADHGVPIGPDGTADTTFVTPEWTGPNQFFARAVDRAGNQSDRTILSYWVTYPPAAPFGDYTGDGRPDLLGVATDGRLTLRAGLATGGFAEAAATADERDWSDATLARAGMLLNRYGAHEHNDQRNDILALRDGKLLAYPGDGEGGFGAAEEIVGYDWSAVTDIAVSRHPERTPMLLAAEGDRVLVFELYSTDYLYVSEPSVVMQEGWSSKSAWFSDEVNEVGAPFLHVRDENGGSLEQFPLRHGDTQWWDLGTPVTLAEQGWAAADRPHFAVIGDLDGDGVSDVVAADGSGALHLHPLTAQGVPTSPSALPGPPGDHHRFF
ncbi:hypothetical protein ACWGRF_15575 [Streptomyces zhihengii]